MHLLLWPMERYKPTIILEDSTRINKLAHQQFTSIGELLLMYSYPRGNFVSKTYNYVYGLRKGVGSLNKIVFGIIDTAGKYSMHMGDIQMWQKSTEEYHTFEECSKMFVAGIASIEQKPSVIIIPRDKFKTILLDLQAKGIDYKLHDEQLYAIIGFGTTYRMTGGSSSIQIHRRLHEPTSEQVHGPTNGLLEAYMLKNQKGSSEVDVVKGEITAKGISYPDLPYKKIPNRGIVHKLFKKQNRFSLLQWLTFVDTDVHDEDLKTFYPSNKIKYIPVPQLEELLK